MGSHALHPLLTGAKVRITALHQHDGTLYAGCADGSVRYYELGASEMVLTATHQLSRRQIDALAVLPVSGQLAVLAGERLSRFPPLPPTPLIQTKLYPSTSLTTLPSKGTRNSSRRRATLKPSPRRPT